MVNIIILLKIGIQENSQRDLKGVSICFQNEGIIYNSLLNTFYKKYFKTPNYVEKISHL